MRKLLANLWADEAAFILSSELVLIATVGVLGVLAAMVSVRDAVSAELTDVANSLRGLDQSYYYRGMSAVGPYGVKSWTPGSEYIDPTIRTTGPVTFDGTAPGITVLGSGAYIPPPPAPALNGPMSGGPILPPAPAMQAPCANCPQNVSRYGPTVPEGPNGFVHATTPPWMAPQTPNPPPVHAGPAQVW
jgi:hypothetical protein